MKTITLKFNRLSAVIVLTFCMLCANNVKSYTQPTLVLSAKNGNTLTVFDITDAITAYELAHDPDFYDFASYPWNAVINAASVNAMSGFSIFPIVLMNSTSLTTIGAGAFYGVEGLPGGGGIHAKFAEANFPNVTEVGPGAFFNCKVLSFVNMPKAKSIGEQAFSQCSSLADVNLYDVIEVGESAFSECSSLIEILLSNVETVGNSAFENCSSLNFALLDAVKSLDGSVFEGCDALATVMMQCVEAIDDGIFNNKKLLKKVEIGSAKSIGATSFIGCTSLEQISLPEVTSIGFVAFGACTSLKQISMPKVTSIAPGAFEQCGALQLWDIGRGFEVPTTVAFGPEIFGSTPPANAGGLRAGADIASNIELTLGENVLPKPDGNTWNGCTWKSVTIQSAPTGIVETRHAASLQVYPNPVKENATVRFEMAKAANVKITLLDMSGKEIAVVYNGFANAGMFNQAFNTGNLPKGVYLLNVSVTGNDIVKKIVIN